MMPSSHDDADVSKESPINNVHTNSRKHATKQAKQPLDSL